MAIIIEEQKKKTNWFAFVIAALLIIFFGAAVYYLFFTPVPGIEKVAPYKLEPLKELSSAKFRPESVMEHAVFKVLKQYVNDLEIGIVGKENPFVK